MDGMTKPTKAPQDMLEVGARVPAWMLDAARDAFPDDTTSELICRGLAILARRPAVNGGQHERKDTL